MYNIRDEEYFYQDLEYYAYVSSLGPMVYVNGLNGELFSCRLLELFDNIHRYYGCNELTNHLVFVHNNQIIATPYLITSIHMLENFLDKNTDELYLTIIKQENPITDTKGFTFDFRFGKLDSFYEKLLIWKDHKFNQILEGNNIINKFYVNDIYLTESKDKEENIIYKNQRGETFYNRNPPKYSYYYISDKNYDYDQDYDNFYKYDTEYKYETKKKINSKKSYILNANNYNDDIFDIEERDCAECCYIEGDNGICHVYRLDL
jgi:hypothetical protein